METLNSKKGIKVKQNSVSTVALRVKRETKRRIQVELAKVNKKPFGRTIRADALISKGLNRLTEQDILELQDASLSNADRLECRYAEYVKSNGSLSKDAFIGKLLSGEILK